MMSRASIKKGILESLDNTAFDGNEWLGATVIIAGVNGAKAINICSGDVHSMELFSAVSKNTTASVGGSAAMMRGASIVAKMLQSDDLSDECKIAITAETVHLIEGNDLDGVQRKVLDLLSRDKETLRAILTSFENETEGEK